MLEKQATSIEVSPLVLLKHAANLRGHVLEDTAEVLHSLASTSFGGRGISPIILSRRIFLKSNRKEHFGVILRILLDKPKHLPPPRRKNVYSNNREKKILHDFLVFCNGGLCENRNLNLCGHGRREPRGPWGRHSSKSSLSIYPRKFSDFFRNKSRSEEHTSELQSPDH